MSLSLECNEYFVAVDFSEFRRSCPTNYGAGNMAELLTSAVGNKHPLRLGPVKVNCVCRVNLHMFLCLYLLCGCSNDFFLRFLIQLNIIMFILYYSI